MRPPEQSADKKGAVDWQLVYGKLFKSQLMSYWPIVALVIMFGVWTTKSINTNESDIRELKTWKNEGHNQAAAILRAEILGAVGSDARRQSDENGNRIEGLRGALTATTAELATFRALTEHRMNELAQSQKRMLEILERK
jgi:hypothetical protein